MDGLCGGVVALFAGKRFLTSVGEPVVLKVNSYYTLVIALIAAEGLLSTVDEHVRREGLINCAFITANWSHVRSAGQQRTCSSLIWGMGIPIGPMLIEQVPKDNVHVAEMDQ